MLNPPPNAASNRKYGQFGLCPAGMGLAPVTRTDSMNPDRFSAEEEVPETLCVEDVDGRNAEVRMLSAVWSTPLVWVWVASPVHPDGRNACPEEMLSPPTPAMKNAKPPAACDSDRDVLAAA